MGVGGVTVAVMGVRGNVAVVAVFTGMADNCWRYCAQEGCCEGTMGGLGKRACMLVLGHGTLEMVAVAGMVASLFPSDWRCAFLDFFTILFGFTRLM